MPRSALLTILVAFGVTLPMPLWAQSPTDASLNLVTQAVAYEHGEGVAKDFRRAAALYCEAALAGNADALINLGWMYANGRGVPRSDAIAATLFARAAWAGNPQAIRLSTLVRADEEALPDCLIPPRAGIDAETGLPGDTFEVEPDPFANMTPDKQKIVDLVTRVAPRYTIEPALALAVIAAESNFAPAAQSPKNAQGLMQLIPETADRFNVRNPFDVRENVRGGLTYLRWLLAYYRGDVTLAIAAYNAGEKAVDRYRGIPPYPETQGYVRRVLRLFKRERHPFEAGIVEPSPILTRAVAVRVRREPDVR